MKGCMYLFSFVLTQGHKVYISPLWCPNHSMGHGHIGRSCRILHGMDLHQSA